MFIIHDRMILDGLYQIFILNSFTLWEDKLFFYINSS